MRRAKIVSVLVVWMALIGVAHAATVKVATYNIWFLKENISNISGMLNLTFSSSWSAASAGCGARCA